MKNGIKTWYYNLPFRHKLLLILLAGGILPVTIFSLATIGHLQAVTLNKEIYALNRGFDQTRRSIENLTEGIDRLSLQLSVAPGIEAAFAQRAGNHNTAEQLSSFREISTFTDAMMAGAKVDNVYYYTNEDYVVVQSGGGRFRPLSDALDTSWYRRFVNNLEHASWIHFDDSASYRDISDCFGIVRGIWSSNDYQKRLCVMLVLLRTEHLLNYLHGIYPHQQLWLTLPDGTILGNEGFPVLSTNSFAQSSEDGFVKVQVSGETYYVRVAQVADTGIYLYSSLAEREIMGTVYEASWKVVVLSILVLIGLSGTTTFFSRNITRRLLSLQGHMQKIQEMEEITAEIPTYAAEPYSDEIGQLMCHYNYMIVKLNELNRKKSLWELKTLQAQINPHFLYNTLEMIGRMSKKGENEDIGIILQAMARYYRLILSMGEDIICIRDELDMCQAYMEIQIRRYRGRIQYEVDVQDAVLTCLIPKITLQPFIENAIRHGILETPEKRGLVVVNGWEEDGQVVLSVTDNGHGIDMEKAAQSHGREGHYGLPNVKRRLSLLYGEEIPIHMESSPGIGTCVYIKIPQRRRKETEDEA